MYQRQDHVSQLALCHLPCRRLDAGFCHRHPRTMRRQAWIHDPETTHAKRFHRDEKSIPNDPHVFVDSGRPFPGQPPLLTTRLHLKAPAAERLWQSLLTGGWQPCDPQWDSEADI